MTDLTKEAQQIREDLHAAILKVSDGLRGNGPMETASFNFISATILSMSEMVCFEIAALREHHASVLLGRQMLSGHDSCPKCGEEHLEIWQEPAPERTYAKCPQCRHVWETTRS